MTIIIVLQRFFIAAALVIFGSKIAFAATAFDNLSQEDFDNIAREFSANSMLHSVMAPSSLGDIFGFQVGLTLGMTKSPEIQKLVKETDPNTDIGSIPHGGLLGAVSVPFGISAEFNFLPEIDANGTKYKQYAAALKWSASDALLPVSPVNVAVRGFIARSDFSFTQTESGNQLDVKYEGRVSGLQLLVSPKMLPIVEPYIGLGVLKAEGDMSLSGSSGTIFDFTSERSAESKPSSSQFLLGVNASLLLMNLGLEYSKAFGTSNITAKLAVGF